VGCLVYCCSVSISRVYLRCHSVEQVIAGSAIGLVTGFMWTFSEAAVLSSSTIRNLLCSKLAKALKIKCPEASKNGTATRMEGTHLHAQ
jgi:hypothetical protein